MCCEVMNPQPAAPFPRRFGFATAGLIYDDFPPSARVGLYHLLVRLVEKGYIEDNWKGLKAEVVRLGRVPRDDIDESLISQLIDALPWDRVFILIERVYSTLLQDTVVYRDGEEYGVSLGHVQQLYESEVNQLFGEESIGYEFRDGLVTRPGRPQTQKAVARAAHVLAAPELRKAAAHFGKAVKFFTAVSGPDHENAAKEAVAALEAAAKALFSEHETKNLPDLLKNLQGTTDRQIPPTLVKAVPAVYAFRGAADGVAHGGVTGGVVTAQVAEWVLGQVASHITYLADFKAAIEADIPF